MATRPPADATVDESPFAAALRSARANLVPGLVLQAFALGLVLAYYFHPSTQAALGRLTVWRAEWGVAFPIVTTGLFGGVIPFLYLRAVSRDRSRVRWSRGLTLIAFWSYKGFEVDLLYRVLARVVGEGNDLGTIATKALFDQLVYCPLIAVPPTWAVYAWIEARFDWRGVVYEIRRPGWYRRCVLPVLVSNLGVWLPAVALIFSLPTALQLPMQNVVLCFFTLMLATLSQRKPAGPTPIA